MEEFVPEDLRDPFLQKWVWSFIKPFEDLQWRVNYDTGQLTDQARPVGQVEVVRRELERLYLPYQFVIERMGRTERVRELSGLPVSDNVYRDIYSLIQRLMPYGVKWELSMNN